MYLIEKWKIVFLSKSEFFDSFLSIPSARYSCSFPVFLIGWFGGSCKVIVVVRTSPVVVTILCVIVAIQHFVLLAGIVGWHVCHLRWYLSFFSVSSIYILLYMFVNPDLCIRELVELFVFYSFCRLSILIETF